MLLVSGAVASLISFVIAELTARAWLRRFGSYYVWERHARTRLVLDPSVLPKLDPVARFDVNERGERGDPMPQLEDRTYKILVAGGSATECYYLDQAASWPAVMQRVLNEPEHLRALGADRVHVGNVSRSLADTRHLCRMLAGVLPNYERLDAIVLLVGGSDVIRWLEHRAPQVIDAKPIPASRVFAEHPEGPYGWSPRGLALRRIAKHLYMRSRRPIEVRENVGKRLARCRAMRARATEIIHVVPSSQPMLDHFEANLRELVRLASTRASRVILVQQPWFDKDYTADEEKLMWSFSAGCPHVEEVTAYYSHALVWRLLRQVNARTAKVARDLHVEQVDLAPALDNDTETYYDELHHTPRGCAVIGNEIARRVVRGSRTRFARSLEPDAVPAGVDRVALPRRAAYPPGRRVRRVG
jgi:hypothetical protein